MSEIKNDSLGFHDEMATKHGLRGHVQIFRENKETGEKTLWYEDDNVITISGYQWILMKMFGLYLDSDHKNGSADITQDTTIEIPDLNKSDRMNIGIKPNEYSEMLENIPSNHFIQGFMIGNGGAAEDGITTKNTDYSFIQLRDAVPFKQLSSKNTDPKYLGVYNGAINNADPPYSYFIKKFDKTPHIYHGWWTEGQKWDVDNPVTQAELGPSGEVARSNRIESYVECEMSLDTDDCVAYFNNANQTAVVNELGLVAYDAVGGEKSLLENLYKSHIKPMLRIVYDNNRTADDIATCKSHAETIVSDMGTILEGKTSIPEQIQGFLETTETISTTEGSLDFGSLMVAFADANENIKCEAYYNMGGELVSVNDQFLSLLDDISLTCDEAQRIKMITYYTFKSIPLQENYRVSINYRIYAN